MQGTGSDFLVWVIGALLLGGVLGSVLGYGLRWLQTRSVERTAAQAQQQAQQQIQIRAQSEIDCLTQQMTHLQSTLGQREAALETTRQQLMEREKALAALSATHHEKMAAQTALQQSLEEAGAHLRMQFQNLANQILEEKGRSLSHSSHTALDALLAPLREQLQGFARRVNEVHTEAVKSQSTLGAQIRQVLDVGLAMSAQAHNLTQALKGEKKTLGNWGEIQLEQTLQAAGLVSGTHYQAQVTLEDETRGKHRPDFVVKLPDDKCLILDSKASLVDYDRAVAAQTDDERKQALDAHVRALRQHVEELARKDYAALIGVKSPDFVLMFLPLEAAWLAALQHQPDLFDHGWQRQVVMVSHTTLLPVLKTVANVWRYARSNEQAHHLSALAGDVYNKIVDVAGHLKKLGNNLQTVSNQYNTTVTALAGRQGLYGKAQRFVDLSVKASKPMPDLAALETDLHTNRLEHIETGDILPLAAAEMSDDE